MRKSPLLTALVGIVAIAASILAFPAAASAANPDRIIHASQVVCLEPANKSASAGVLILQAPCDGSPFQRWTKDGQHFVNNGSGQCLDAGGPKEAGHIQTIQWPCSWISNQNWQPGSSVPGAVTTLISRISGTSNQCLELPGGSPGFGNGAWLSRCNGTFAQQWLLPG